MSFDQMWEDNLPTMQSSCSQWGVADDSSSETDYMKQAIQQVSSSSGVDPRFILAIIMQESSGCVRVVSPLDLFRSGHMTDNTSRLRPSGALPTQVSCRATKAAVHAIATETSRHLALTVRSSK